MLENFAGDDGVGVAATGGSAVRLFNNRIWNNRASNNGGGISATWNSFLRMRGNSVLCNRAGALGGGLRARNSHVECASGVFQLNRAARDGGGASVHTAPESLAAFNAWLALCGFGTALASFSSTTIRENFSGGDGGGLHFEGATNFIPML